MYKKILYLLVVLMFMPIFIYLYNIFLSFAGFKFNIELFYSKTIINSLTLSIFGALTSLLLGLINLFIFYIIKKNYNRYLFVALLFSLFIIEPVILLSALNNIAIFKQLSPFTQTIIIETLHLFPLNAIVLIYIFNIINLNSVILAISLSSLFSTIRYILLPQIKYKLLLLYIFTFILIFTSQDVASILGYRTYAEELLTQITLLNNLKDIIASTIPLAIFILLFFIISKYIFTEDFFYTKRAIKSYILVKCLYCNYIKYTIISLLFIYLTFLFITFFGKIDSSNIYNLAMDNIDITKQTFLLSIFVSFLTIIVSLIANYLLIKHRVLRTFLYILIIFYLLIPHSVVAMILIKIFNYINISNIDFFIYLLGYIFVLFPIANILLIILNINLFKDDFLYFMDTSLFNRVRYIYLPKYKKESIIILAILTLFAINELDISILLIPPGFETTIIKIYNLLHYGDISTVYFLSFIQLVYIMLILLLVAKIWRREDD